MKLVTCGYSAVPPKAEKILCVGAFEQEERAGNVKRLSLSLFAFLRAKRFFYYQMLELCQVN